MTTSQSQEEAQHVGVASAREIPEKAEARRATGLGGYKHEEIPEESEAWMAADLGGFEHVVPKAGPDALWNLGPLDKAIEMMESMEIAEESGIKESLEGAGENRKETGRHAKTNMPHEHIKKQVRGVFGLVTEGKSKERGRKILSGERTTAPRLQEGRSAPITPL